jgi:hypothetical protein
MTVPILDSVIAVKRLTKDSGNSKKESYVVDPGLNNVKVNLQVAGGEEIAIADGVFGQTYTGFTTCSGLRSGDHITVSGTGETMVIRGLEDWSGDPLPHFEFVAVRMEEDEV